MKVLTPEMVARLAELEKTMLQLSIDLILATFAPGVSREELALIGEIGVPMSELGIVLSEKVLPMQQTADAGA